MLKFVFCSCVAIILIALTVLTCTAVLGLIKEILDDMK